jgi:hypothetical protein
MQRLGMLLIVLLISIVPLFAQDDIIAEGFGIAANKDEALMAAKRDAIEKGIGMILISQTETENFMIKKDLVISKTIGAVKNYQVISETKASDGAYEIKIKATLSRSTMKEDLASFQILVESMDKPRVMVIISEDNCGSAEPSNQASENAIVKFLKDPYGFELVDPSVAASIRSSKQKMAQLAGDVTAAVAIGTQNGAEVLITGTAISRKAEGLSQNLGGMVSVQADITLRAINCTTGRIIGSESAHAAKVHVSPLTAGNQSIAKASDVAIGKLLDGIIKDWQGQLNNGIPLSISVKRVVTFRQKTGILQTLKGLPGISAVRERSWDAQSALLQIDVEYKGNTTGFCEKVDGYKMATGGGSLAVTGVNGQNVSLAAEAM